MIARIRIIGNCQCRLDKPRSFRVSLTAITAVSLSVFTIASLPNEYQRLNVTVSDSGPLAVGLLAAISPSSAYD